MERLISRRRAFRRTMALWCPDSIAPAGMENACWIPLTLNDKASGRLTFLRAVDDPYALMSLTGIPFTYEELENARPTVH